MDIVYTLTREAAAKVLGVSTRTIDRYIKSWRLTYKKIGNKVVLSKTEIESLKSEFNILRQESWYSELIWNEDETPTISETSTWNMESSLDKKLDKIYSLITDKDRLLEDKNRVIFLLQQRIGELETKIQHMVALPQSNPEKQETIFEKDKLESRVKELWKTLKAEKIKNLIYMAIIAIIVIVIMVASAVR